MLQEDDPLKKKIRLGGPSVASLLSDCGVTRTGWVLRKGTIFWNKRFLVIKQDEGKLYYFKSNLEPAPQFVIELSDGISIKEEHNAKKNHYCFSVYTANSSITFACKSSSEQEEWISSLVDAGIDLVNEPIGSFAGKTIYDFTCKDIDGNDLSLEKFRGMVCLVVNVATK